MNAHTQDTCAQVWIHAHKTHTCGSECPYTRHMCAGLNVYKDTCAQVGIHTHKTHVCGSGCTHTRHMCTGVNTHTRHICASMIAHTQDTCIGTNAHTKLLRISLLFWCLCHSCTIIKKFHLLFSRIFFSVTWAPYVKFSSSSEWQSSAHALRLSSKAVSYTHSSSAHTCTHPHRVLITASQKVPLWTLIYAHGSPKDFGSSRLACLKSQLIISIYFTIIC